MKVPKTVVAVLAGYGAYAISESVLCTISLRFLGSGDIEQGLPDWISSARLWFRVVGSLSAGVVAALVAAERPFVHSALAGLGIGLVNGFFIYENMAAQHRIIEEPMDLSGLPLVAGLPLLCAGVGGTVIHWLQSTKPPASKPLQSDRDLPGR